MTTNVCILATCLNGKLDATLLVFKTLRVGFPTANVLVFGNGLLPAAAPSVKAACKETDCAFVSISRTSHDAWIDSLVEKSPRAFWVCDTDIVFHASVEGFATDQTMLKGRFEPPFVEPWSGTVKAERLHTSLLYLNAPLLRIRTLEWMRCYHPEKFPFSPTVELIRQQYVPMGAGKPPMFVDTCAGLYLALGGESFTDEENSAFDHLHCGTYVDRMGDAIPGLAEAHAQIYEHPEDSRALKVEQNEFYTRQAPIHV